MLNRSLRHSWFGSFAPCCGTDERCGSGHSPSGRQAISGVTQTEAGQFGVHLLECEVSVVEQLQPFRIRMVAE